MDKLAPVFDEEHTAELLDYKLLVDVLRTACLDYEDGAIQSPARLVMRFGAKDSPTGTMLSMPASAPDIAVHKLVNVVPDNRARGLPTIHAAVSAYDVETGAQLFALDGSTVTARRTAAISALAIRTLLAGSPKAALLYGIGKQATQHVHMLAALYPDLPVFVRGRNPESVRDFCDRWRKLNRNLAPCPDRAPDEVNLVITATTSKVPVYEDPAVSHKLVVGVGAFTPDAAEIGARTVLDSTLFVDDLVGARHEAGDLILAGADWSKVRSLADALRRPADLDRPILFKSVGCAAWDLAACRLARQVLESSGRLKV